MTNTHQTQRRWQFSLLSFLMLLTTAGIIVGLKVRVTPEERAIDLLQPKLDDIWYTWQHPRIGLGAPVRPEYSQTVTEKDGTKRKVTRYRNITNTVRPDQNAERPKADFIDRLLGRSPRVHVYGVLLPTYNADDEETMTRLKRLPQLEHVIVRFVYEDANGASNPILDHVRRELPKATVVGEIAEYHPKNRPAN